MQKNAERKNQILIMTAIVKEKIQLNGKSLYIFGPQNKIRKYLSELILKPLFDISILSLIILTNVLLAFDNPLSDPESQFNQALDSINTFATIVFLFECVLKVVVKGFILNGKDSYLSDSWNILDFVIVVSSTSALFMDQSDLKNLVAIRTLRVLRPLRLISRNKGLKLAINSLLLASPSIINLAIFMFIFYFLFGIIGIEFIKGQSFYCDMINIPINLQNNIKTQNDCYDYGGDWINQKFNFDNILNSVIQLFFVGTSVSIETMMFQAIDTTGLGLQPKLDQSEYFWSIFYCVFFVVSNYFFNNLFAAVVVDSFNRENERLEGYTNVNKPQRNWIDMQINLLSYGPSFKIIIPTNKFQKFFFDLAESQQFEKFLVQVILLNMFTFLMDWDRQHEGYVFVLYWINYGFLWVYVSESIIKILAYGFGYFKDKMNVFDFSIVILSILSEYADIGGKYSFLRSFRVLRLLRLIKKAKNLNLIFNTMIKSLPSLVNVGSLLCLFLFVFSILGSQMFAYLRVNDKGLTADFNFQGFSNSVFMLLRIATDEDLDIVMQSLTAQIEPNRWCYEIVDYKTFKQKGFMGCGSQSGTIFVITFFIFFTMMLLNLFVAVILENYERIKNIEQGVVTNFDIDAFQHNWSIYCYAKNTSFIHVNDFNLFLHKTPFPLGFQKALISRTQKRLIIGQMGLIIYQNTKNQQVDYYYNYYDVLFGLVKNAIIKAQPTPENIESDVTINAHVIIETKKQAYINFHKHMIPTHHYTSSTAVAAEFVQETFKNRTKKQTKLGEIKDNDLVKQFWDLFKK